MFVQLLTLLAYTWALGVWHSVAHLTVGRSATDGSSATDDNNSDTPTDGSMPTDGSTPTHMQHTHNDIDIPVTFHQYSNPVVGGDSQCHGNEACHLQGPPHNPQHHRCHLPQPIQDIQELVLVTGEGGREAVEGDSCPIPESAASDGHSLRVGLGSSAQLLDSAAVGVWSRLHIACCINHVITVLEWSHTQTHLPQTTISHWEGRGTNTTEQTK